MWLAEHRRHQLFLGTPPLCIPGFWWCFCHWPGWNPCPVPHGHSDISRSVSCVSKETKVSKSWFSSRNNVLLVSVCVSILSSWVQRGADLLTRERHRPCLCHGSRMSSGHQPSQAPGVILTYSPNHSFNLRGSLEVKQGKSKLLFQAAFLKVTQKLLVETKTKFC